MLKQCAFVLAIAACGGGSKPAPKDPTAKPADVALSECAVVAVHVADVVFTFKDPPPTTKDVVAAVVTKHCEGDAWSAAAKHCFAAMKDEETAAPCVTTLTEDQHNKVMADMESHFGHHDQPAPAAGGPLPAPDVQPATQKLKSAPPPPAKKSRAPAKSSDPCEGGE